MMSWPAVPRRVATMASPQASFSRAGSYMPTAAGVALNRAKGGVRAIVGPSSRGYGACGTAAALGMEVTAERGRSCYFLPAPLVTDRVANTDPELVVSV